MKEILTDEFSINTNDENRSSVADIIEFLKRFDPKRKVQAYEGEGGSWIVVRDELEGGCERKRSVA